MSDLFEQPAAPESAKPTVQQLFVDEAGTPTLLDDTIRLMKEIEKVSQGMFLPRPSRVMELERHGKTKL